MAKKISDDAVQKNTGKTWKNWFLLLNKAGAKKMEHKDIAQLLSISMDLPDGGRKWLLFNMNRK